MGLFSTENGLFMGGVVNQSNTNRQLSVQEAQVGLQKTRLGIEMKNTQQEQASKYIEELVNIATEIKKNFPGTSQEFASSEAGRGVEGLIGKASELSQQTGLPEIDYRAKVRSTPTATDAATMAAQKQVVEAENKIEAAGDDPKLQRALGVAGPSPKDGFMNVPGVGLVDIRGDKPVIALSESESSASSTRYKNVAGVGLVDLRAENGPAVVIPASDDPTIQKVIAPILNKLAKGEELTDGEQKALDIYQRATTTDLLLREALAGTGSKIPSPKTKEEYDAIPPGTEYHHPDDKPGETRTKK